MNETGSSSSTLSPETTEVLYDPNEIVRRVVERCHAVKYTMDGCIDANGLSILLIPDHPVIQAFVDMKNRDKIKVHFRNY